MTDRELLEMAAKAAGYNIVSDAWACGPSGKKPALYMGNGGPAWNPLEDDGDALRLAVKLNMCVTSFTDEQMVGYVVNGEGYNMHEDSCPDPYAATRRAIVRAAAAIGEKMP